MRREFGAEMHALVEGRLTRERELGVRWTTPKTIWFLVRDSLRAIPGAYAASLRDSLGKRGRDSRPPRISIRERILQVLHDLRYALRTLVHAKGFTTAALLTLALGIGANTAIFSVVNGIILRPLPYNNPDELVMIWSARPDRGWSRGSMSQPDLRSIQAEARSIGTAAGYHLSQLTITGLGDAESVQGARVTDGLLSVIGQTPSLGRDILAEENVPNGPRVVLIGHAFWQERLGGNANVIGTTIQIFSEPYEIIGVAPPGFDYPGNVQLWIPRYLNVEGCNRDCHFLRVIARVADGFTVDAAAAEVTALSASLEDRFPVMNYGKRFNLVTLEEEVIGNVRTALLVLLGAVGFVLLIACANVANLLLARSSTRAGEVAMRSALGATRGRIVGQLMIEAVLLAALASIIGVMLARVGLSWLLYFAPPTIPRLDSVTLDGTVIAFAIGTAVLVTLLFGLAPAFRLSGISVVEALGRCARGTGSPTRDRSRSALLVAEVALSLMLLFGAGVLLKSFSKMSAVDLGFERESVLTFTLSLPGNDYDAAGMVQFYETLEQQLTGLHGVISVTASYGRPLSNDGMITSIHFLDKPPVPEGQEPDIDIRVVTPSYHETLGIPLLRGRLLEPSDRDGVTRVAVVSQALVDLHYSDRDPIGKEIIIDGNLGFGSEAPWTIVGVVADARSQRVVTAPEPEIYVPHAQMGSWYMTVLARNAPDAPDPLPSIRRELQALDPAVPMRNIETLEETVDRQMGPARFYMTLLAIFAGVAVTLAAIGLYGVVSYLVSGRTREIGIRMALGANAPSVVRLIVSQGIGPVVVGVAVGIAGVFTGSRVLQSMLFGVEPTDPLTVAIVTVLLLAVVLAAILLPARRASRITPIEALRVD
jgi:predicted permease